MPLNLFSDTYSPFPSPLPFNLFTCCFVTIYIYSMQYFSQLYLNLLGSGFLFTLYILLLWYSSSKVIDNSIHYDQLKKISYLGTHNHTPSLKTVFSQTHSHATVRYTLTTALCPSCHTPTLTQLTHCTQTPF